MNFVPKITSLVIVGILTWLSILVPLLIIIKLKPQIASYYALFPVFIITYFLLTCKNDKCVSNLTSLIFRKVSLLGSIALVGGFIKQIFFVPNLIEGLGFLWPFLFTMPLGVMAGIFWGFVQWFIKEKKGFYLKSLFQFVIVFSVMWISRIIFHMTFNLIFSFSNFWLLYYSSWFFALIVGWFAWKKISTQEESLISNIVLGAVIFGATGVAFGVFGVQIINPGNEQAILGILYGPPGFIIGGILGAIIGKSRVWSWLLWICTIASVAVVVSSQIYITWHSSKYSSYIHHASDLQKRDKTLKYLWVRPLSDDDLIQLERFENLYGLYFDTGWGAYEAKLTDVGLKNLSEMKLPNLGALTLSHCSKITDHGLKYVADIPTLKYVGLAASPQITNAGLFNLSQSNSIDTLDLRGCNKITDKGVLFLSRMPKLKQLKLGGCANITMNGIEELRKRLPNILIEKDDKAWAYELLPFEEKMKVLNQKRTQKTPKELLNLDFNLSQSSMKYQPKKIFPDKFMTKIEHNKSSFNYAAWATVTPSIDGLISDGEWDDADRADDTIIFTLRNQHIIEAHHAICLVKNDANYLYIALIVKDDDYQIYPVSDGIDLLFYKTFDDSRIQLRKYADDLLSMSINGRTGDFNMNQPQTGSKPNLDKIQNLDAAVSHSNPIPEAMGHYVFELRHPWNGHDKLDDIQLVEGDTVAFRIRFADGLPTGGSVGYNFPNAGFATITIKGNQ